MTQVLAVDDSVVMRRMITLALKDSGYEVVCAENGVEALDISRTRQDLDLVITDLHMPRLDGLGLIRELRTLRDYRTTPILVLSTESSADLMQQGRQAGATGWLVKPFDPGQLLFAIEHVLAHCPGRAGNERDRAAGERT